MAFIVSLTDGVTTIPLVHDQANQFAFKATYGTSLDPGEPVPVWHAPEGYPPQLIDLYDPNRVAILGFHLKSTTAANEVDDVNNALATLRRWVDGAHQQAARFHIHGDVNRIDLIIQRDNSIVATYHPVVFGTVDDGQGQYTAVAHLNNMVYDAVIRLTLAPYGETERDIELYNVLSGAAVDYEGTTSGLAAGWVSVGTTTNTLDTGIYLVNGMSQKCDASTNGGVRTANVAATATSGAGYVWLHVASGSVAVTLYDETAAAARSTAVLTATDSNAVSDKSVQDRAGNTWWRVPVSSAGLTNTNNHSIRVLASGAAAVFYADAAYLRFATTAVPDAWCSYSSIQNRADQDTTNFTRRNWVDTWGIPGDVDALVRHIIDGTTTEFSETFIMAAYKDKRDMPAINFDHMIEGEDATEGLTLSGSFSDEVVAGTSGGSVKRYTSSAGDAFANLYVSVNYIKHPVNVWVRARASLNSQITMNLTQTPTTVSPDVILSAASAVTLSTDFKIYNLGTVQLNSPVHSGVTDGAYSIRLASFGAGSRTADIDCVFHMPIIDGQVLIKDGYPAGTLDTGDLVIDGANEESYIDYRVDALGIYPTASAGQNVTRFYYQIQAETNNNIHHLTDTANVTLQIVPRTKHLFGTV